MAANSWRPEVPHAVAAVFKSWEWPPSGKGTDSRRLRLSGRPPFFARGVGCNEEDPLTVVIFSSLARTHHDRPCGVARFCHRVDNPVSSTSSDCTDILKCEPSGSNSSRQLVCIE